MTYDLPATVEIGGEAHAIRSDYRAILDILSAINEPDFSAQDKAWSSIIKVESENSPKV